MASILRLNHSVCGKPHSTNGIVCECAYIHVFSGHAGASVYGCCLKYKSNTWLWTLGFLVLQGLSLTFLMWTFNISSETYWARWPKPHFKAHSQRKGWQPQPHILPWKIICFGQNLMQHCIICWLHTTPDCTVKNNDKHWYITFMMNYFTQYLHVQRIFFFVILLFNSLIRMHHT